MKFFDCFMYCDEDIVLDLRLNYLNNFIDKFIIVESKFTHSGKTKKLNFKMENFKKFEKKIIYLVLDHEPKNIQQISETDDEETKNSKYILNGMRRDFYQRNYILNGIKEATDEDLILISDLDEIPKLEDINFDKIKEKFIFFRQKMYYYKFNLCSKSIKWTGTRGCKKKYLKSPQWLRNIKDKSYPIWRFDIFFSNNKYFNIKTIQDGGWHFSYLKTPEAIESKLKSYAHHREYELNDLGIKKIQEKIKNKESIYNLKTDMKNLKFGEGQKLDISELKELPNYLQDNVDKYQKWLE